MRLHWKNEYEDSVSDSSNEDNILQEDSKTAPSVTANVEALTTNDAAKDELIYKEPRRSKRQKKPPKIRSSLHI